MACLLILASSDQLGKVPQVSVVTIEAANPAGTEARVCLQAYFDELAKSCDPSLGPPADTECLVPPAWTFRGWTPTTTSTPIIGLKSGSFGCNYEQV